MTEPVAKLTGGRGGGRHPWPVISKFWAPCHHIVNFVK